MLLTRGREEFYRDAEEESRRFAQAMDEYSKTLEDKKKKGTEPPRRKSQNWEDVLHELEDASQQYNDPSGTWGKIRKAFRRSGDKAGPASAWLALMPTQSEYFSVLCGGLKLIIGVSAMASLYLTIEADLLNRPRHDSTI